MSIIDKIIIGQECICPDGLGRVVKVTTRVAGNYTIKVNTYINNRSCDWDSCNVTLLPIYGYSTKIEVEPWYTVLENFPCLCWVAKPPKGFMEYPVVIIEYNSGGDCPFMSSTEAYWLYAEPLTEEEIQSYLVKK